MQEEVNQKRLPFRSGQRSSQEKCWLPLLAKVVRALQKHHRKALTPQGRQSVKKLMNHYGGKSAMPYGSSKGF